MKINYYKQIDRVSALARTLIIRLKWNKDLFLYRHNVKKKELKFIQKKHIIILAPHSDDEWVGCSQLLINGDNEITIINMDMPGGDSAVIHKRRYREMLNVAKNYNVKLIKSTDNKIVFLKNFLETHEVDLVLIPCIFDWHIEHIEVMELLYSASIKAGYNNMIGMYQVSVPIPDSWITHCSVMTKSKLKYKWNKFYEYYPSQKYLPVNRFIINERINGAIIDSYAIESYSIMMFKDWHYQFNKYKLNDNERHDIYTSIQDIDNIRKKISHLILKKCNDNNN